MERNGTKKHSVIGEVMSIGKICRNCDKTIREHTKNVYIPYNERIDKGITYKKFKPKKQAFMLGFCDDKCKTEYYDKKKKTAKKDQSEKIKITKEVWKRDNNKCIFCSLYPIYANYNCKKLEIHRLIPGSDGGNYTLDNVVLCCKEHHQILTMKSNKFIKKWINIPYNELVEYGIDHIINPEFVILFNRLLQYSAYYIKHGIPDNYKEQIKFYRENSEVYKKNNIKPCNDR